MLLTILYFLLALFLLITVHEYGHFQVARWCGVKVLRFSFGFGKILASCRDKNGTEYAWSLFPFGGYVKMLDESEGKVAENERQFAFNNQSIWKKIAVILAGPLFNFLFALVALWLVLVIGMQSLAPMIGSVQPNSIASRAGLMANEEIIAINHTKTNSWRDVQYALMPYVGSQNTIQLTIKSLLDGRQRQVFLPLSDWKLDNRKPELLGSLGIKPYIPSIPPRVGDVVPNSPADKGGLQKGDTVLSVDGRSFTDWLYLVNYVRARPETQLTLVIKRKGSIHRLTVYTDSLKNKGKIEGFLGLRSQKVKWPDHWLRTQRQDPITAISTALQQTLQLTGTTYILIGRLMIGRLDLKSISGPVGIAQGAGESGRSGLVSYLFFLALVSVSLGALNLLPIPMLDGGQLLYYLLEAIRRQPISDGLKSAGAYLGLFMLVALMCIALINDISRLTG